MPAPSQCKCRMSTVVCPGELGIEAIDLHRIVLLPFRDDKNPSGRWVSGSLDVGTALTLTDPTANHEHQQQNGQQPPPWPRR